MKFLLDENISQTLTRSLRRSGFKIIHVLDVNLGGASDEEILNFALKKKLTIITHDKDFGNLIRFRSINHYGVMILRFKNQKSDNVFFYLSDFLGSYKKVLKTLKSRLVILREKEYRIV